VPGRCVRNWFQDFVWFSGPYSIRRPAWFGQVGHTAYKFQWVKSANDLRLRSFRIIAQCAQQTKVRSSQKYSSLRYNKHCKHRGGTWEMTSSTLGLALKNLICPQHMNAKGHLSTDRKARFHREKSEWDFLAQKESCLIAAGTHVLPHWQGRELFLEMDNQISAKMLLFFKIKVTVKNKTGFELNAMRKNLPKSIKHCFNN